jgi:hypothetical protein
MDLRICGALDDKNKQLDTVAIEAKGEELIDLRVE